MAEFIEARFKAPHSIKLSEPLFLEVAVTPEEHARGLMGRTSLPWNHGMLFSFHKPGRHGFWMKDTHLPLDVAWLSPSGVITELAQLRPGDLTLRTPQQLAQYAIELNAGTFRRLRIDVGDVLHLLQPAR